MPAPQGNRFWEVRSSHGRAPIFTDPDQLWSAASEYFAWVEANPLYEDKIFSYQGDITHAPAAKMRAMTLSGLCIFLDIDKTTWENYTKREDFFRITAQIAEIIRTQKFEGAASDLLNANIIARELGMADRQEHSGPNGTPIQVMTGALDTLGTKFSRIALSRSAQPVVGGTDGE